MGIKEKAQEIAIKEAIKKVKEDPDKYLPKLLELAEKMDKDNMWKKQYDFMAKVINDPTNNWYTYIKNMLNDIDENILDKFISNFIINSAIKGIARTHEVKEKEGCGAPWAIVMDPTTACNMKCTGCWAAEYGKSLNLGFDTMDKIVTQGKELGTFWYLFTGGEPLVKKDEVLALCKKHQDCLFVAFTNSTLIDEEFAKKVREVGNLSFSISVEGTEESTDARRGKGTYQKVMHAMDILKKEGILFGFSTCDTSANCEYVMSEAYFDKMIEKGCKYGWFFNYMPVGCSAATELITTPKQREMMYDKIKEYRSTKPIFTVDFWNDGRFVGGCIAGGKHYLHINANGDVEPCVFIHYSNANIKDMDLIQALKQPIFKEYQANQPFNGNLLKPCPLLDNSGKLAEMVKRSGAHSTDLLDPEDVDSLNEKTKNITKDWGVVADRLWEDDPKRPEVEKLIKEEAPAKEKRDKEWNTKGRKFDPEKASK